MSGGDAGIRVVVQRSFYVGMAVLIAVFAVIGFWPSYWGPLFSGTLDMHWLLHLHGIVFTSWVILLVVQAGLVRHGRLDRHRQLGTRVGIVWGLLVFTIGLAAVFGTISPEAGVEYEKLEDFIRAMMFSIPNIMGFGLLFGAALYLRNRPAAHKRLMVFATLMLLSAATARMGRDVVELPFPASEYFGFAIPVGLGLVVIGHDWRTRDSVHSSSWIGVVTLAVANSSLFVVHSEAWIALSESVAGALEAVLLPLM